MKPKLTNFRMLQNAKNFIADKNYKKINENNYINIFIIVLFVLVFYFLNFRYNNKNIVLRQNTINKNNLYNKLLNYHNSIKTKELIEVLTSNNNKKIYNEYKQKIPDFVKMNMNYQ